MELTLLFCGFGLGFLATWFIAKYKFSSGRYTEPEIQERYVLKELFTSLETQADLFRDDLFYKEQEIRQAGQQMAMQKEQIKNLEELLATQKKEVGQLQEKFKLEFENIANRLLEEKSQKFTAQNHEQLSSVLNPLKEKIKEFEASIERRSWQESKDRISLKKEIEQLRDLNTQLSQDANNLATALKGESKTQGDWGELRLELLLEKAGLVKDMHYLKQPTYKDEHGNQKRPDFIINLPEKKHLIIDSKVSLVAYERYFNTEDPDERQIHLKAHLESVRQHIKDLAGKNYQQLYQINTPDYLLLFIPIEPAFSLAIQSNTQLYLDALEKNIVLVTSSTLLATLRTVSFIWKQEKQKRNVLEIAHQSGLLYDKFCNFVNDLETIGSRLESAQASYDLAMNKLKNSKRRGDTLIGRAEKIRELGAKTSKALPKEWLEEE